MRKLILLVAMVASTVVMQAQDLHFGVKLGGNYSNMTVTGEGAEYAPYLKGALGYQVGVLGEYMLNEKLGIVGELNYSTVGADIYFEMEAYGTSVINDVQSSMTYLQVPIMAKFHVNEMFSFEGGLQYCSLLSSNYDGKYTVNGEVTTESGEMEGVSSSDFGLNLGASYKLENGMFFNLRYTVGLGDIDNSANSTSKINTVQLNIGYYFN